MSFNYPFEFIVLVIVYAWRLEIMILSILFSVAHALEETYGEGSPLWDYFGRIANVKIPEIIGFVSVSILLPIVLSILAIIGYSDDRYLWALSLLCGARLGDTIFSHWLLWIIGYRPNPGIFSSVLYVFEVAFLFTFDLTMLWFIVGVVSFAVVIPSLYVVGILTKEK